MSFPLSGREREHPITFVEIGQAVTAPLAGQYPDGRIRYQRFLLESADE
jgi:hypothetical protein